MPRKGKRTKHSAKELAAKAKAAKPKGGGKKGMKNRRPVKKAYRCYLCMQNIPDPKTLQIHWDSKHSKSGQLDIEKATMT